MISSFIDWLVNIIDSVGYLGVGLAMFIESFFAPIPSEIILPFSGFVASKGSLDIVLVILVASAAAYLGTLPFYFLGFWGKDVVIKFLEKYGKYLFVSKKDMDLGFDIFEKQGSKIVLLGRLIPIVRTVISFPAGVAKMPFGLFSLYTIVGTLVWSTLLSLAGFYLGSKWDIVAGYVSKYEKVILVLLLLAIVLYVIRGIKRLLNHSN